MEKMPRMQFRIAPKKATKDAQSLEYFLKKPNGGMTGKSRSVCQKLKERNLVQI